MTVPCQEAIGHRPALDGEGWAVPFRVTSKPSPQPSRHPHPAITLTAGRTPFSPPLLPAALPGKATGTGSGSPPASPKGMEGRPGGLPDVT